MTTHRALLIAAVILILTAPAIAAQTATQQDVLDSETRLRGDMDANTADIEAEIANQHSTTGDLIRLRFALLEARMAGLNDTMAPLIADLAAEVNGNTAHTASLAITVQAIMELVSAMAQDITELRNETLQDHMAIYDGLVDAQGNPILPTLAAQNQGITQGNAAIVQSQYRTRADLDNLTGMMQDGFNVMNEGQEATFVAADSSAGRLTFTNVLLTVLTISNLALLSYALKVPAKLWTRLEHEGRRVERRGEYVEPPCPAEDEGLELGQFFACEHKETCPVAVDCRNVAVRVTEQAALEGVAPEPANERSNREEVVDVGEKLREQKRPQVVSLAGFGSA